MVSIQNKLELSDILNINIINLANFIIFDFLFLNYHFLAYQKVNTIIKYNKIYLLRLRHYGTLTSLLNILKLKENKRSLKLLHYDKMRVKNSWLL